MPKKVSPITSFQELDIQNIATKEPLNDIRVFLEFCENDIQSATKELEGIQIEKNRKHLQKLVYVNLINRFDYLIDKLLLWFSINNKSLRDNILGTIEKETISKKEVFEIFFAKERSYELITEKIKELTRSNVLRSRHSSKLLKILDTCLNIKDCIKPRVNNSNGKIFTKTTGNKNLPNSIIGYADWLYSRRNSLVHGDGIKYTPADFEYIKKTYNTTNLSITIRLQLTSITSAVNFYTDLLKIISDNIQDSIE
ncbi:MAG: hypothetical protein Q8L11_00340 [Candidatus Moranbacteria bacterium]|nr:hypothetical protein [Candidatus Moranbacteria bacterium]